MAEVRASNAAEKDLSDRQRYWLKHLRAAERKGEPLAAYAERLGLAKSSLYEAKRRLRACGVICSVPERAVSLTEFVRVELPDESRVRPSLRVRLASGALLEWSEVPRGAALRELVGLLS
jgi:Mn-dependent DtxR family transcriptional regulator